MSKNGFLKAIKEIVSIGVGRNTKNTMQNYMFRSADDVMDTVTPILAKYNVILKPVFEVVEHKVSERPSKTGISYTTSCLVKLTLSFYDATEEQGDGLIQQFVAYGEANDTGDKCVMKAQTSAYKYALIFGLGIPVTGTADPDYDGEPPEIPVTEFKPAPVIEEATPVKPQEKTQPKPTIKVEKSIEELTDINVDDTQKEMLEKLGIKL